MQSGRARLQREITAAAYAAFAAALMGLASILRVGEADYQPMEDIARGAIRYKMSLGWTQMASFLVVRQAVSQHLQQSFPTAPLLQLQYADDEVSTLIEEELGLDAPTLH